MADTRKLRAHGHEVFTPTLTGLGERSHLAGAAINLETHIQDVINVVLYERLTRVVLCGHSGRFSVAAPLHLDTRRAPHPLRYFSARRALDRTLARGSGKSFHLCFGMARDAIHAHLRDAADRSRVDCQVAAHDS